MPAGGSAAAAVVAMAAGLVEKAARLSTSSGSARPASRKRAAALRQRGDELIELDAIAYIGLLEAIRAARGLQRAERERITRTGRRASSEVR